ncbi:hypothetical protein [Pandoraea sputorum]|uniref:hypothetical protein n=1 Tax=Pandoraea sputorum TaxID=93222 RepID=UPI0012415A02|nr:hypothetical protein [Pandoraea sputorum]VVE82350.1 hypothetical protein PSP31120_03590 [Pandoraea sputorum]
MAVQAELLSDKVIGWIISGFIGLILWAIQRWLEPAAKLGYWIPHDFLFVVPLEGQDKPLHVQTSTLTVQNLGRKAAEKVEISHEAKPDHFHLHPRRNYEERIAPDGTHVISVESLGPKEVLQIQVLSHKTSPVLIGVRCSSGVAKSIRFQINKLTPKPILYAATGCMLLGAFMLIYWIVRAALYISRANGML